MANFLPGVFIIHTQGKDHLVTDALSLIPAPLSAMTIFMPCPTWLTDIHIAQERDSSLGVYCQLTKQVHEDFHYEAPLLMFKGKLVILNDTVADDLREIHDNTEHLG